MTGFQGDRNTITATITDDDDKNLQSCSVIVAVIVNRPPTTGFAEQLHFIKPNNLTIKSILSYLVDMETRSMNSLPPDLLT